MTETDDPFERAVHREAAIRRQRGARDRDTVMRLAAWSYASFGVLWGAVVAAHWIFFPEPRWLVVVHTMAFAVLMLLLVIQITAARVMLRRLPRPDDPADDL